MDILADLIPRAEQVEVFEHCRSSTAVSLAGDHPQNVQSQETEYTAVRLIRSGRLGFTASTDQGAQVRLVESALQSAKSGPETAIQFPGAMDAPRVSVFDPSIAEMSVSQLEDMGLDMIHGIRSVEPGVRLTIRLCKRLERKAIRNHAGANAQFKRTRLSVSCEVSCPRQHDTISISDHTAMTGWTMEHRSIAHRMAERLRMARQRSHVRSGQAPVLLSPAAVLALLGPLLVALNGKNVLSGGSLLAGRTGERITDQRLTLIDDPTLAGKANSAPYDDEGMPHHSTPLIRKGILVGYLTDLHSATGLSQDSTGNGVCSRFSPPEPAPTNVILNGGDTMLADMIASISRGLWVDQLLGLGQSNPFSGAFSCPARLALGIERGEVVGYVPNIVFSGNAYRLLNDISAISAEREWVQGGFCLPYILLSRVRV